MAGRVQKGRRILFGGVSAAALLSLASGAHADATLPVAAASAAAEAQTQINEQQRYALRMMMQVFDGRDDVSQSQLLGIARAREGNRSYSQFDYGDGAVVIDKENGRLAAGRFMNVTNTEKEIAYDYDTKKMYGDAEIAGFHNAIVRPLLTDAPELGSNASWTRSIPLSAAGMMGLSGGDIAIELSREYFIHDGKEMVLLHYAVPAFSYDAGSGTTVVQWGEGLSLTDPGFGMIYINSALHRAVARANGSTGTPYRMSRTMVASNPDGSAMVDYRTVAPLQKYLDDFFSAEAMRVVPTGEKPPTMDTDPLNLMRNLDIIAFSMAENSANETPMGAAAQTAANSGNNVTFKDVEGGANRVNQGNQVGGFMKAITGITGAVDTAGNARNLSVQDVVGLLNDLTNQAQGAQATLNRANQTIKTAETALKNAPVTVEMASNVKSASTKYTMLSNTLKSMDNRLNSLATQIDDLTAAGKDVPQELATKFDDLVKARNLQATETVKAFETYESLANNPANLITKVEGEAKLLDTIRDAKQESSLAAKALQSLGAKTEQVASLLKSTPTEKLNQALNWLGNSKAGTLLDGLGHVLNVWTSVKAVNNIRKASTQNIGSGDLPLTREYSSTNAFVSLGTDLLGLAGNALTLNVPAFASDATAITLGSVGDIVIAYKGVVDADEYKLQAARDAVYIQKQELARVIKREEQAWADLADRPSSLGDIIGKTENPYKDGYDTSDPRFDPETGLPKPAYWAYLKKNDPQKLINMGIDPDAPVGGWPGGVGPEHRPGQEPEKPTGPSKPKNTPTINEEPDYPTAPPRDPDADKNKPEKPQGPIEPELTPEEKKQQEIDQRRAENQAELDKLQAEKIAKQKQEEADRNSEPKSYEYKVSKLETSDLVVSAFDMDPVESKPVTFDPVTFDPVVFDEDGDLYDEDGNLRKVGPPDFKNPDISLTDPTDPDDVDGYPGIGEYPAATWDTMIGQEPDLAKWEDWLATQDRRKLEQLARAAGYPSLAFALGDAENIIAKSLDSGFRAYANRGPNCAGTTGCIGSIGPWKIAYATIRLGDILAQSRDIFSTGGLSDIGISGFRLGYALRDFGLVDGDRINVEVLQYGRTIFKQENFTLRGTADNFNVNVRGGVAQMVITALNEGTASPNTAEVVIDNVVRGEAVQNYNLNTGQTAVLRIESGVSD